MLITRRVKPIGLPAELAASSNNAFNNAFNADPRERAFFRGYTNIKLRSKLIAKLVGGRVNLGVRPSKKSIFL